VVDSGVKSAQLFIGRSSLVADVYGVKTDKEFVNTLEIKSANGELWISSLVTVLVPRTLLKTAMPPSRPLLIAS
jgi:hypothetical protein